MYDPLVSDDMDFFLLAVCEGFGSCRHSAELDRAALIEKYGPDLRYSDLRRRLTCSVCGRRGAGIRIGYRGGPMT